MREIKFRAWNKVFKRFVPVACLYFNESSNFIGVYMGDETEEEWTAVRKEHLELMQYTGLKDMYNVEIYEGDVIEYESEKYFVEYETEGAHFAMVWCEEDGQSKNTPKNKPKYMRDFIVFIRLPRDTEEIRVIGNIYENPELLEVRP